MRKFILLIFMIFGIGAASVGQVSVVAAGASTEHFVGSGNLHWLYRDKMAPLPAYNNYPTTPTYCPANDQQKVEMVEDLKVYKYAPPLYLYNHNENALSSNDSVSPESISSIDCLSN